VSKPAQLWIVAGPNGSGKSTLAAPLLPDVPIINPDEIALALDPDRPGRAAMQAGREALRRITAHLAQHRSFAVETTLAGTAPLRWIQRARDAGYRVHLIYLGLREPALSLARIEDRVARGGHVVPPEDAWRRYHRSLASLPAALARVGTATILDNSGTVPRLVLDIEHGIIRQAGPIPPWLRRALPGDLHVGHNPTVPRTDPDPRGPSR
jgi:predicted ABC-type ATPase